MFYKKILKSILTDMKKIYRREVFIYNKTMRISLKINEILRGVSPSAKRRKMWFRLCKNLLDLFFQKQIFAVDVH